MTKELIGGDKVEGVYDLRDISNERNVQGRLHLSVQYVSKDSLDKMEDVFSYRFHLDRTVGCACSLEIRVC